VPATGDRITKRKDGLFQGMYTAQTPDGPKRKYIYGPKKKDVERRLAETMGDAAKGIVFDTGTLTVGQWLDSWLSHCAFSSRPTLSPLRGPAPNGALPRGGS
jgi:hypothetical protein